MFAPVFFVLNDDTRGAWNISGQRSKSAISAGIMKRASAQSGFCCPLPHPRDGFDVHRTGTQGH